MIQNLNSHSEFAMRTLFSAAFGFLALGLGLILSQGCDGTHRVHLPNTYEIPVEDRANVERLMEHLWSTNYSEHTQASRYLLNLPSDEVVPRLIEQYQTESLAGNLERCTHLVTVFSDFGEQAASAVSMLADDYCELASLDASGPPADLRRGIIAAFSRFGPSADLFPDINRCLAQSTTPEDSIELLGVVLPLCPEVEVTDEQLQLLERRLIDGLNLAASEPALAGNLIEPATTWVDMLPEEAAASEAFGLAMFAVIRSLENQLSELNSHEPPETIGSRGGEGGPRLVRLRPYQHRRRRPRPNPRYQEWSAEVNEIEELLASYRALVARVDLDPRRISHLI